jgi:hypothetical protein
MILECSILQPRFKTRMLTPQYGIATGPVNSRTFQSTDPLAGILKLDDRNTY